MLHRFAAIFAFVLFAAPASAQSYDVDMTGVDRFWEVSDLLSRGIAPDSAAWHALFDTPGYASLDNDDRIRQYIELVFDPRNAQRLDSAMTHSNYWRRRDLTHLVAVRESRAQLRAYQASIDVDDVVRRGIAAAEPFLPEGGSAKTPPPLRFVIFSPDARVMNGNIIFDLAHTRNLGDDQLVNLMGHEFHHFFYPSLLRAIDSSSPYAPLVRALRQLQVEGVADLVDKPIVDSLRAGDPDWQEQFRRPFDTTRERLAALDSMLVELRTDTTRLVEQGTRALNELFPMGGHPNGYAMSRLIEEQLGRPALIASLGNPFEFVRLYDRAARRAGRGHAFSADALAYIAQLEARFLADGSGAARAQGADDALALFRRLDGVWACTGAFADGRPLAADLTFTLGDGRALHYRHVDHAPSTYRQDAIWGFDGPSGTIASSVVASIAPDRPTDLAFFVADADAWTSSSVELVSRPLLREPWAPNRFRYTIASADQLRMVWEVRRGEEWRMGDYLNCSRVNASR